MASKHVLLIEDNESLLGLIGNTLREEGHRVIPCRSGEEGLAFYRRTGDIDIIVTDLNLPGKQGHEVVNIMQAEGFRGDVIAMTADPKAPGPSEVRGRSRILWKPFTPKEFLTVFNFLTNS